MQQSGQASGQRAPKVGSTKSRGGCTTCRSRRVRCDQARPACSNCNRLGLECTYGQDSRRSKRLDFKIHYQSTPQRQPASESQRSDPGELAQNGLDESRERRLMELRLLHHWMTIVSRPFMSTPAPRWGALWRLDLPLIAFKSDGVLYALLTMSATHLLPTLPPASKDHDRFLSARDQYLVLALEHQRTAVENIGPSNVDELSFAALLISLNAFSMLRERQLEPYEPPMAWLEMGRGAGSVMRQAAQLLERDSSTKLQEIITTTAPIHLSFEPQDIDREALKPYEPILNHASDGDSAVDDPATSEVYVQTLHQIAAFRKGIQSGEPPYVHLRRICMFPFTIPGKFIELVRERRPRALVILAHFFVVIAGTEALQYLGNTGDDVTTSRREVVAIQRSLPQDWQQLMIWPVDEVGGHMER